MRNRIYNEYQKRKIREWSSAGYHVRSARDRAGQGVLLGKEDENIAVDPEALEQLAKEPVILKMDRSGRAIKPGEKVEGLMPWSYKTYRGLHSAQAPEGLEDFIGRYGKMDKSVESILGPQALNEFKSNMAVFQGKDEYRVIRTLTWPGGAATGGGPTSIMLIGVLDISTRSSRLASRAVYEVEPSAMLVELCRERIGQQLIMPREHKEAVKNYARGFATTNPHRLHGEQHHIDTIHGDSEALNRWTKGEPYAEAVKEFVSQPVGSLPKLLCLGDVRSSTMERIQKEQGNETRVKDLTHSPRAKQLARGIISMATSGHKVILAIMDTDRLGPVTTWLERAGAVLLAAADASDIENNRESLAADIRMGLEERKAGSPQEAQLRASKVAAQARHALELDGRGPLGFFLNDEALDFLTGRQQRLLQMTRLKDLVHHTKPRKHWEIAEELWVVRPGERIPGPETRLQGQKPLGLRFEYDRLEIPDHYLREAGMEKHADDLWRRLIDQGQALEPTDPTELSWWSSGAIEAEIRQNVLASWPEE
ncbi:unnamed protein product [Symbiodinium pilosum]|uniref:Uncharacterized protein n=1 Tax=Symbiodinium pilosum TaxID=2952 RepID=A0A812JN96_SYMPI|nr:unnamed protein product [Symbiodinium pilosum]